MSSNTQTIEPTTIRASITHFVVVIVLACIGYVTAGHHELFFDSRQLINNESIRTIPAALEKLWHSGVRPGEELSNLTFAINYAINSAIGRPGLDVTGFLITNVLIHALNSCLVFRLLLAWQLSNATRRPTQYAFVPFIATAIFAVHPIHSTSVAYILQRRGMLATTFYVLGMILFIDLHYRPNRGRAARAVILFFCFWLSIKCKNVGLTLPIALLGIEFCLRAPNRRVLAAYLKWLIPGLALSGLGLLAYAHHLGIFDLRSLRIRQYGEFENGLSPWSYFVTECRILVDYWKLLLLPLPRWLAIDHDVTLSLGLFDHLGWLALAFHLVALILAIRAAIKGYAFFATGVMLFYISLLPYAFVRQTEPFVEYKVYLAAVGFSFILAEALHAAAARWSPRLLHTLAALAILCLTAINLHRNLLYRDLVLLWKDVVEKSPYNDRGYGAMAVALAERGRIDEAEAAFRQAMTLRPNETAHVFNLAKTLMAAGRIDDGIREYRTLLASHPGEFEARYNLANTLFNQHRYEEAATEYRIAVSVKPDDYRAHFNLANTLQMLGRRDEALEQYREVLRLKPDHAAAQKAVAQLSPQ